MSEEGELKKRIHKAYGELDDGICHEECLPNIDKILEAMWQEFPKKTEETFEEGYEYDHDYYDADAVDAWFLRWKGKHE